MLSRAGHVRSGRWSILVSRRCIRRHSSLPPEFEALFDDHPPPQSQPAALPLDAIVSRSLPAKPVSWPAVPRRKGSQTLAREFRACIAANDIIAALAILRGVSKPYPRLLAHAAVHALLRVDTDRAGNFLLAFATEPTTFAKPPRMHPLTLDKTIKALLNMIPRTQGRQDRARCPNNASILSLDAEMVSEPCLRTALALYLRARKLFVPRRREATMYLWRALLDQREFLPAALFFQQQVTDFQLYKSLPSILHSPDPAAPLLTPHDREYLRRRLAALDAERIRPSESLFADVCYRIHGVLSSIIRHPESGYVSQDLNEPQRDVAHTIVGSETAPSKRFPDTDPDGAYAEAAPREPRGPLTSSRARYHVHIALQALTILGALVHTRQIPFPEIARWIHTVGNIPPALESHQVYTRINGIPTLVVARDHLRTVLEAYTCALPRTPHIFSTFHFSSGGRIRRGLQHMLVRLELKRAEKSTTAGTDSADETFPRTRFSPPDDPVEAADDSFMPPPSLPTLQSLLGVFLNDTRALLYEYSPSKIAAAADFEPEHKTRATPLDRDDWMEERVHQHYHAPRSPNNPDPRLKYPAHPLDFAAYPAPPVPPLLAPDAVFLPSSKLGGGESQRHRAELAARVLQYMMHERNPRLPPWQSPQMMRLLWRRTDVLQPVLEKRGLWDELWTGAAQAQREAERRESAARSLTGAPSLDDHVNREEEWEVEKRLRAQRDVEWEEPRTDWSSRAEDEDPKYANNDANNDY
ncbi:hypothetical protein B0H16DRAFT_1519852 [Mycena metata]|uniref:Uncharacterized protein n=1 Tax=Mycena metata TaxID=1033252 RepID=A0AAD7JNE3_9AGAR|nr:hypothetical protein B0H16DRAFT_1519852 [Mycena metata]